MQKPVHPQPNSSSLDHHYMTENQMGSQNLTRYGSRESNPRTTSANFPSKYHGSQNSKSVTFPQTEEEKEKKKTRFYR